MACDAADLVKQRFEDGRRKHCRGFIEKQHLGPHHQRAAKLQESLLASAECSSRLRPALLQRWKQAEHFLHSSLERAPIAYQIAADENIFLCSHFRKDAANLR